MPGIERISRQLKHQRGDRIGIFEDFRKFTLSIRSEAKKQILAEDENTKLILKYACYC